MVGLIFTKIHRYRQGWVDGYIQRCMMNSLRTLRLGWTDRYNFIFIDNEQTENALDGIKLIDQYIDNEERGSETCKWE